MTSTAPSAPASSSARARAAVGSGSASTRSKWAEASAASSAAGSDAAVAALRRDERRAEHGQRLEHHPGPLVAQDRADDDPAAGRRRREPRQQPADAREVVRSVPDLERVVAAPLEPAGQHDVVGSVRVDRPAEERLRRSDRQREVAAPGDDDRARAVLLGELAPLRLPEHDRAARLDDRELLGRDRLARLAEHVHVVERDAREDDDAGLEDVRRVVPAAESGLDDGDVDLR